MQGSSIWGRKFAVGKSGEGGNQDAACASTKNRRFAVADGVAQTAFPGDWARLLVRKFTRAPLESPGAVDDWVEPIKRRWLQKLPKCLPWNVKIKLRAGASSTLVGLEINQAKTGKSKILWRTTAIGDSCLFQVRGEKLLVKFPMKSVEAFGYVTAGVSTEKKDSGYYTPHLLFRKGYCRPGDDFFLTTDALAKWIIRQPAKKAPWRQLRRMRTKEEFENWIESLRSNEGLENDDVVLIRVSISNR